MSINTETGKKIAGKAQRAAVSSPLRMEILGLFTSADPLSISDIAALMNRNAGSLYHHVGILEEAGILEQTGTRPKGKRHEALYFPTASSFEFDTTSREEDVAASAVKMMATGFRMAERDLEAAFRSEKHLMGSQESDFCAFRLHLRASPEQLTEVNEHISAILELLAPNEETSSKFGPDDQHVSLTLALLPIKGRDVRQP